MKNIRLFRFFTIIALIALILIRLHSNDASTWISCLNYIGLVIAIYGFLIEFSSRYKNNRIANFVKGVLLIIIAALVVGGCFIVTGFVELNTLVNDEILLLTLLVSLPTNYYCELLDKVVSNQPKKEHTYGTK